MAQRVHCDRCEATEIKENCDEQGWVKFGQFHATPVVVMIGGADVDLCPSCYKDFEIFLTNPKRL